MTSVKSTFIFGEILMKKLIFILTCIIAVILLQNNVTAESTDEVVWEIKMPGVPKVILSPDGNKLYIAGYPIAVLNTENGDTITYLNSKPVGDFKPEQLKDMEISKDGHYLVSAMITHDGVTTGKSYGYMSVIDLQKNEEIKQIRSDSIDLWGKNMKDIALSPDGKTLVMICGVSVEITTIIAFNVETGQPLFFKWYTTATSEAKEGDMLFDKVEFSPDGSYFATVGETVHGQAPNISYSQDIKIWDSKTFEVLKTIPVSFDNKKYKQINFSDNTDIFGFVHDNKIDFYNSINFNKMEPLELPQDGWMFSFDYSQEGNMAYVALYDGTNSFGATYNLIDKKILHKYTSLFLDNPVVSKDNKYIYGRTVNGVGKFNAIWNADGIVNPKIETNNLVIYPNPSTNELKIDIKLQNPLPIQLNITDATGRTVTQIFNGLSATKNTFIFKTRGLAPGAYFVNLIVQNKILTKQFIVTK